MATTLPLQTPTQIAKAMIQMSIALLKICINLVKEKALLLEGFFVQAICASNI